MLTAEDNELLARVEPGSVMGGFLRRYWLPAFLSEELPEADGRALRTRLLGEDLVAFRDTDGEVGIVSEFCLHRGASLYFGRNEECGIRCVYHGWKYNRQGDCVDMPNEPPTSAFKDRIHLRSYKVHERNGIIWVYMGPRAEVPEPPRIEWSLIPREQALISKRLTRANWAQVLEGGIDSSHGQFLHRGTIAASAGRISSDTHPVYEVLDRDYGALIAARRNMEDESKYYWRIYQFLMPFYTMVPGGGGSPIIGHAFVPRDDVSTMVWSVTWHPTRAMDPERDNRPGLPIAVHVDEFREPTAEADSQWEPIGGADNDYLVDWERQKTSRYSGIPNIALQDAAMQESMGAIYSRADEHLGTSDAAILKVRRRWMALAKAASADATRELPGENNPESFLVRSCSLVLPKDEPWLDQAQKYLDVQLGVYDAPVLR